MSSSSNGPVRKGGGFEAYARASAISRFLKRQFGVSTINGHRGMDGVRVSQEAFKSDVYLRVSMQDETEAIAWAEEIKANLTNAGYQVSHEADSVIMVITKADWKFDDMILSKLSMYSRAPMESDEEMIKATTRTVNHFRQVGWVKQDTRELTEEGQQVRKRMLEQQRKNASAERRKLKSRGW